MDTGPPRLELVPMDAASSDQAPPSPSSQESSTTTAPEQDRGGADASRDAIEITPVERPFGKAGSAPAADPFVAQASREYAQGRLDTPLWDRALSQSNGDAAAAAPAYIRARAVALRIAGRERREATRRAATPPAKGTPAPAEPSVWQRYKAAIVAAALVVPAAIAGAVFMGFAPEKGVATSPAVARGSPAKAAPGASASAPGTQQAAAKPPGSIALAQKVQELRDAGNFNVMVLYATEWTRKEPDNAQAWDELRVGYVQLRQYEDARSAAKKAVQLAPDEARLWRGLAAVNMDLDDPEGALAAYEQAAARNGADVESLHAVALLQARLGRPQESKAAFDRAAQASPGDPVTACLRNGIAQMPAARDGYTLSRQIRAIDNRCHGKSDSVASAR